MTDDRLSERYMRKLARFPALSREEEREIAVRAHDGDKSARNELMRKNLRLVVKIAFRYKNMGVSMNDLVAEGNIGLIRAAELYDPNQGARFSTYASLWIKQKIIRYLEKNSRDVRIPEAKRQLLKKLDQTRARLEKELGRPPLRMEIFASSGLSRKEQREARLAEIEVGSLDAPLSGEEEGATVGSRIRDEKQSLPRQDLMKKEKWFEAVRALEVLNEEELEILTRHFGLKGQKPESLRVIGKDFNLSRERIRQKEEYALTKARRVVNRREKGGSGE